MRMYWPTGEKITFRVPCDYPHPEDYEREAKNWPHDRKKEWETAQPLPYSSLEAGGPVDEIGNGRPEPSRRGGLIEYGRRSGVDLPSRVQSASEFRIEGGRESAESWVICHPWRTDVPSWGACEQDIDNSENRGLKSLPSVYSLYTNGDATKDARLSFGDIPNGDQSKVGGGGRDALVRFKDRDGPG